MNKITQILHTKSEDKNAFPVNTPIYQSSAFKAHSPFFYSRKNNPNVEEIEKCVAILEEANYALGTNTGMSAISIVLNILVPGGSLVVNKDIYGCSLKAFQKLTSKLGTRLIVLDLSEKKNYRLLPKDAQLLVFETPTNPFLKTIDITSLSSYIKKINPKTLVVVDNTWATPLFQQPLKWGADIVIHSATKYFSGHSDVMGGFIVTNNETIFKNLSEQRFYSGAILEPFSAWLLKRSLQTFALRMKEHQRTTLEMKKFLKRFSQVEKIYYPEIDKKQLTGYGTLIFFEFRKDLVNQYENFMKELQLFDSGTGMACVTSMVAQPFSGSHSSLSENEKKEMGISKRLMRLSFGFENRNDLKNDLTGAFKRMSDGVSK
ncbi:MAG: cystathionine gamma-synthase [Bacteroidetes bacterium RIFCSPLOWO2_02_FULL_36_8]|nr:MAG: cystathionine gamma-synthase [Bacteroidetes bacterium RIFCSPLOWO2_02_FULL_36_8]OFY69236.1 MAG: cystathionine gamma-synthase [Bacteroidetes bacterium RIFCSPLOWO2_12_FULL_37_12]